MYLVHAIRIALFSTLLFTTVSGHCTNPRVRKEWRSLCADERAAWINAVKCLAKLPHDPKLTVTVDPAISLIPPITPNSSYFDDFVYAHMDLSALIHSTGFFFPWHRLYLQIFEDELRSKCGYEGVHPYWDWTQDAADFYHATIFSDSDYDGLGSWGDPNNDYQLPTGGFKDMVVAYPVPHHIRRNFSIHIPGGFPEPAGSPPLNPSFLVNTTFTITAVETTLNATPGDFISLQAIMESFRGPHPGPHIILGGDNQGSCPFGLGPPACYVGMKWSSNDPMFFLHHAMIDKIWYDWQNQDPKNKNAFGGGSVSWLADPSLNFTQYPTGAPPWLDASSVIPGDGLWDYVTVGDVMDTVGKRLCYIYD